MIITDFIFSYFQVTSKRSYRIVYIKRVHKKWERSQNWEHKQI